MTPLSYTNPEQNYQAILNASYSGDPSGKVINFSAKTTSEKISNYLNGKLNYLLFQATHEKPDFALGLAIGSALTFVPNLTLRLFVAVSSAAYVGINYYMNKHQDRKSENLVATMQPIITDLGKFINEKTKAALEDTANPKHSSKLIKEYKDFERKLCVVQDLLVGNKFDRQSVEAILNPLRVTVRESFDKLQPPLFDTTQSTTPAVASI